MRKYLLFILATMAFSLGLAFAQAQPGAYPPGTTFTLENAQGNILWTNGQPPTSADLSVAAKLVVTLPDGTSYTYQVSLKGSGQGLGEVMVSLANGQPVSFEAMLHSHGLEMTGSGKVVGNNQGTAGNDEHQSGKLAEKVEYKGKSSEGLGNDTKMSGSGKMVGNDQDAQGNYANDEHQSGKLAKKAEHKGKNYEGPGSDAGKPGQSRPVGSSSNHDSNSN